MNRRLLSSLLLLTATLVMSLAGPACRQPEPGRLVVLLLMDAARADRLSTYGYSRPTTPNLDALADQGLVFLRHYSQASYTRASLPSLLYSRYFTPPLFPNSPNVPLSDPENLFRRLDDDAISLPRALGEAGFDSVMISAHTWLKPETAFAREFDEVHDLSSELDYPPERAYPPGVQVVDFTIDWLSRNRGRDVFLYLHLMDPHAPRFFTRDAEMLLASEVEWDTTEYLGMPDAPLRAGKGPDGLAAGGRSRALLDAIYDGSLIETDRQVGRLIDQLRSWGVLDRSVLAVTADHGEHLGERPGSMDHGGPWYEAVARVPFILYAPGRVEPGRIEDLTESVDVAPTVFGVATGNVAAVRHFDGRQLLAQEISRNTAFGTRAVRLADFKVLFDQPEKELLAEDPPDISSLSGEIYDLEGDPFELDNLWSEAPDVALRALSEYRSHLREPWRRHERSRTTAQPESAFAIGSRFFETEVEVPGMGQIGETATSGWLQSRHSSDFFFAARSGAPPLAITFPVPNGSYEVSAMVEGVGAIEVVEGDPRPVSGAAREVSLGTVDVQGDRFIARLRPDGPLVVRYFGFRPLGGGVPEADAEREERLRSLGYVD